MRKAMHAYEELVSLLASVTKSGLAVATVVQRWALFSYECQC